MTPAKKKPLAGQTEIPPETYVVCLDCGKQFTYDWENMRIGKAADISGGSGEPVEIPGESPKLPFQTKSKLRYLLLGSAVSAAVLIGKRALSRKRAQKDGQGDDRKDS